MARRAAVVLLLVAATFLPGAAAAAVDAPATTAAAQPRPNVLVIMTDDQTLESLRVMSNVKRLLRDRGATFRSSFVTYALCCPSRATFLTGQYAHNHGVLGNRPPNGGYEKLDHTNTLPVWLQDAGYYTAHLGKYLNGYGRRDPTEIPPGYDEWRGSVDPTTYRFYDYTLNENGRLVTYESAYQTDLYARKAARIIRRRAPSARPFFLWVAFLAPHGGGPREPGDPVGQGTPVPAPRHRHAFDSEPLPRPPGFNEAHVSDKPVGIRNRPLLGPRRIRAVRENYRQRLESLLAVDEAVARLVGALRSSRELDDTLVIFTSDNGFFHGEHRVPSGKILPYEPSIRVPLIMRGPGIPAGLRVNQRVANIDLAPTIVDAAGATPGRIMDGRSLLPVIARPNISLGRDLLIERGPGVGTFTAVRAPNYFYAEYGNGEQELYDLVRDPYELRSRHADPAYAAIRENLAERLAHLRACNGLACRTRP
ncbi:MAG: sulfatase family protein [Gaiellaceae bacterium]